MNALAKNTLATDLNADNVDIAKLSEVDRTSIRDHLAREILVLDKSIKPTTERIEKLKERLRQFGPQTIEVQGLGKVSIATDSTGEFKRNEARLDVNAWDLLTEAKRQRYLRTGLIKMVAIYGQVRQGAIRLTHNV